jgi:peptide/nickel transport system substrate-binding protein
MSLRTRRGLALGLTLLFVAAACTTTAPATPTAAPTEPGAPTEAPTEPGAPTEEPTEPGEPTEEPTGEPTTEPTADPGEPTTGGTLVIGEWQTPTTVNPYLNNAWVTQQAAAPLLASPLKIDDQGTWIVDLLADIPVATEEGDGFTLTMTMKPGLTWSDGEALDANDLVYTYELMKTIAEAGVGCGLCGSTALRLPDDSDYYITGEEVSADGLSVTFNWRQKYAGWLVWAAGLVPLPEQYFGTFTPDDFLGSMPLSSELANVPASGPFVVVDASTSAIDYARNDSFYDPAYLDGLRRVYFGDKNGMIAAFLTGEVDQISNMTQIDYDAIKDVPADIGRADLIPAWQYEHLDLNGGAGIDLDRAMPPGLVHPSLVGLDDPAVRNAIHLAIDKEDLWNTLFPGHPYVAACSNAPPSSWWYDDSITCPAYDPDAAMAALDAAGWVVDEETGLRTKDGNGMRLTLCTTAGNPTRLTTLGKINQYLLAVGIPSDIRTADAGSVVFSDYPDVDNTTECALSRGNYHISLFTYLLSDPGSLYYSLFHSANLPPNGDNGNWTRISDPDLDAQLEAALEAITQEDILGTLGAVQQAIVDLKPEIPLYYRGETSGISRHVGGFAANPSLYGPVWNVQDWYFIP